MEISHGQLGQVHRRRRRSFAGEHDHVAVIRPHRRDRGFAGNEVIFAAGNLSSIMVIESEDYLTGSQTIKQDYDEV
jgi:hypothetical protein